MTRFPRSPDSLTIDFSQSQDLPPLPQDTTVQELWQTTLGWQPNAAQWHLLQRLYHGILLGNRLLNLTRITEPEEFLEKHLWDSLSGIRSLLSSSNTENQYSSTASDIALKTSLPAAARVIDIGSGAGFPGIPVAIARPEWRVTLLDSTRKKTAFLNALCEALPLPQVNTLTDRVEAVGHQLAHREQYDIALLRAVAPAAVCAEYALPLMRLGGLAVLYRGHWNEDETTALLPAVDRLGGELLHIDVLQTPITKSDRHCIWLKKVAATPKEFPRATGIPSQKPLG